MNVHGMLAVICKLGPCQSPEESVPVLGLCFNSI